jgi:imidazolonepropionase-like amidohydrolase
VSYTNFDPRFEAATAHSFHLSEVLALQSVTSVPARSLEVDHRIGYVRPGYDADLVVWDSHPLSVGATALQVYIDGRPTLDPKKVEDSLSTKASESTRTSSAPSMRKILQPDVKEKLCRNVENSKNKITISGIKKSYLNDILSLETDSGPSTIVIDGGKIICFDSQKKCSAVSSDGIVISLENGYVLPGLIATSVGFGLAEIETIPGSSDGDIGSKSETLDIKHVVYAKYGIHLDGRGFARARIGGVTRAITAPLSNGFAGGVSVGIKTSGKKTILDGGIFQDEIALHFTVGQDAKSELLPMLKT